jgi:hypothetical protein
MANRQWPQNADDASTPLQTGVKVGVYAPAEAGATKNVRYDIDDIKAYTEGTLSSDIAQNASDIADNTAAIGVNTGLINQNTIDISSLESSRQANLPIGTILMYDGASWTDNVTLPGWYSCIAANAGQGCPDLVDSFIKGRTPAVASGTGGSNSITLSTANLPPHDHGAAGNHIHTDTAYTGDGANIGWGAGAATIGGVGIPSGNHTHASVGSGTAFDNQPEYYTVIYIRRCS